MQHEFNFDDDDTLTVVEETVYETELVEGKIVLQYLVETEEWVAVNLDAEEDEDLDDVVIIESAEQEIEFDEDMIDLWGVYELTRIEFDEIRDKVLTN